MPLVFASIHQGLASAEVEFTLFNTISLEPFQAPLDQILTLKIVEYFCGYFIT